jgi:class 3 adenylate cyclase/tetratricopeptide (TPR) repeat protein
MKPDSGEPARLEAAIAALEGRRAQLGDNVVDAAQASMRVQLRALRADAGQEQRKLVTVLFADLVGSTPMTAQLDPEEVQEILQACFSCWSACIETQRGVVEKYIGDAVVAVFGLHVSNEADPRRAIRAGLAMRDALHDLNLTIEYSYGLTLAMRVGIHTGRVVVSTLQDRTEREFVVVGDSVNLASRLQDAAPPDGILISHATYQHTHKVFDLEKQAPLHAKGIGQPVQTYLVKRERPCAFQVGRSEVAGMQTPLVGRDLEMGQLQGAYQWAAEMGETCLITLMGEPGVGKTRLVCAFDQWLSQQPEAGHYFRARASQPLAESPYGLLRQMFSALAGIQESDAVSTACQKLEAVLQPQFSGAATFKAHLLGALLGFDFTHSPHVRSLHDQPGQLHQQGRAFLQQFFRILARKAPVVLLLEDIHWADESSLDGLAQVIMGNPNLPLLVVCSARPEFSAENPLWTGVDGGADVRMERLVLRPLSPANSRLLGSIILQRVEPAPYGLIERIITQAEGNPYYLEEIIKALIEDGMIRTGRSGEAWQVDQTALTGWRPPPTLTALLEARLDSLPRGKKQLLQQAAVVGRTFWDAALPGFRAGNGTLAAELADLCQRELISQHETSIFQGAAEYSFKHQLLRDVAYRSVLKRQRGPLHGQVADWLAAVTQENERVAENAGEIAGHYLLARKLQRAAVWYVCAGQRAKGQGAFRQAYEHFDRALALFPEADLEARWPAMAGRSETALILGMINRRQADDRTLIAMAKTAGDDDWLAEAYYRQGFACAEARRALVSYRKGLAAARRARNQRWEALTLALMVISQARLGGPEEAARLMEEALSCASELSDQEVRARVLTNAAVFYSENGDLARAIQAADQAVALCGELDNLLGQVIGLENLGYQYVQLGLPDQGREKLVRAMALAEEIGAQVQAYYAQLNLGLAAWRSGTLAEARQRLESALAHAGEIADPFAVASNRTYLALALESMGEFDGAVDQFSSAMDAFLELGVSGPALDARAGLARCLAERGQEQAAQLHTVRVWDELETQGSQGLEFPLLAYQTCVENFAAAGERERAKQAAAAGINELQARAARIQEPGWRKAYLEKIPEHQVIAALGRELRTGDSERRFRP